MIHRMPSSRPVEPPRHYSHVVPLSLTRSILVAMFDVSNGVVSVHSVGLGFGLLTNLTLNLLLAFMRAN